MHTDFLSTLALYNYQLPPELIAQKPAKPRDSAKLLVYRRSDDSVHFTTFRSIGKFLPKGSLLVLNETKVIPAKLIALRSTGGKVSLLWLGVQGSLVRVFANRQLRVGEYLKLDGKCGFTVEKNPGKEWLLRPDFPLGKLQKVLDRRGTMPLPPYIKHCPLTKSELRREYQSVFAKASGSIAAPTASLHFTKPLLKRLQKQGIGVAKVTLHVHLGTFAPLTEDQWKSGRLHTEEYFITSNTKRTLEKANKSGQKIVSVGTTVTRTLESATDKKGKIVRSKGSTDLFIRDGYRFHCTDALITNFHVPRSSLLMLVSAFAGREKILELYSKAIARRMRFFSFGDAMLIVD